MFLLFRDMGWRNPGEYYRLPVGEQDLIRAFTERIIEQREE